MSAGAAEEGKALRRAMERLLNGAARGAAGTSTAVLAACCLPSLQLCTIAAFQDLLPLICNLHLPPNSG